jgi:hypothetical protein
MGASAVAPCAQRTQHARKHPPGIWSSEPCVQPHGYPHCMRHRPPAVVRSAHSIQLQPKSSGARALLTTTRPHQRTTLVPVRPSHLSRNKSSQPIAGRELTHPVPTVTLILPACCPTLSRFTTPHGVCV